MADITAIILTKNEELNIEKCILSVKPLAKRILVIDSYSTDKTVELAENLGAEVYKHAFENHAKQFIYGLNTFEIKTQWILKLDADEELTEKVVKEIEELCIRNKDTDINGIELRFEIVFMGKPLRHGGAYPFTKLCIFKYGIGYMEERNLNEHIMLKEGRYVRVKNDSIHRDYKDLTHWIDKHNSYATKEVMDFYSGQNHFEQLDNMDQKTKCRRIVKYKIFYKLPSGIRNRLYFMYRFYVRLGFLDGKEGRIFTYLQAYWYHYLIDAKLYEKQKADGKSKRRGHAC